MTQPELPPAPSADTTYRRPAPAMRTGAANRTLWAVFGVGVIGNTAVSVVGSGVLLHVLFGALTACAGLALVARYLRTRH